MTDSADNFFQELSRRGRDPRLGDLAATVRFDIEDGQQTRSWRVVIDHGTVNVSPGDGECDCAIVGERHLVDAIVRGESNAMAALLRGELCVTGNPEMLIGVQRLFPGRGRRS
jgi:hypothetical protein